METVQTPGSPQKEADQDIGSGDLSLSQVVGSVFAAGFGVQSKENKERDFTRGKPLQFIAAGLLFTFALLFGLVAVVSLVI